MATPPAKPPSSGDNPAGDGAPSDADLTAKITAVVSDLLAKQSKAPAGEPDEGTRPKRRSFRDEEDDMADAVRAEVARLLAKEKASGENHPAPGEMKAPPEPVPAQPQAQPERKRRVESFMRW